MRVDFYLLNNQEANDSFIIACRLVEKAYRNNHRVFVYCDNENDANNIDELLWTYKEDSFIPHNIQGEGPNPSPVVQIGYQDNAGNYKDILINLSKNIPPFFKQFKRILEIVSADENAKEISRQHYREYKKHGCQLITTSL